MNPLGTGCASTNGRLENLFPKRHQDAFHIRFCLWRNWTGEYCPVLGKEHVLQDKRRAFHLTKGHLRSPSSAHYDRNTIVDNCTPAIVSKLDFRNRIRTWLKKRARLMASATMSSVRSNYRVVVFVWWCFIPHTMMMTFSRLANLIKAKSFAEPLTWFHRA